MNKDKLKNAIKGALYGVAVGDALGAPLEFMSADQIKRRHGLVTEMIGGGWLSVKPGEITDDTQMTLAVAEGIVANPGNPIEEVGTRFIEWMRSGPKDIGGTCSASISRAASIAAGRTSNKNPSAGDRPTEDDWYRASKDTAIRNGQRSGGNGALMRTVYPGLFYRDRQEAKHEASDISRMTHWDGESDDTCQLYTHIIHGFIQTEYTAAEEIDKEARDGMKNIILRSTLKDTQYDIGELQGRQGELNPTGYVVDSMKCAVSFFWHAESFEEAVISAANMGGDADTIAAITGGLAGAYYGYDAIPERWIRELAPEVRERLDRLTEAALKNRTMEQRRD
jgi:ADP-ribosyl-[dinitrogen reductase] hydrolase